MKKSLSVIIAVLLVVCMMPIAILASADPVFNISDVSAEKGQTVSVKIDLQNNPGIASCIIDLYYDDTAFTYVSATYDSNIANPITNPQKDGDDSFVRFTWVNGLANVTGDFTFVEAKFLVNDTADAAEYPLELRYDPNNVYRVENYDFYNVNFGVEAGSITVTGSGQAEEKTDAPSKGSLELDGSAISGEITYDGNEHQFTVSGAVEGSTVLYTVNGTEVDQAVIKEVGNYTVAATVSHEAYKDYVLNTVVTINPREVTISVKEDIEKVYDGTADVAVDTSAAVVEGAVEGDDVGATFRGCKLPSADVGTYTADLIDVALTGADAENYKITSVEKVTVVVKPKAITVTARSYTKNVGEADPEFAASVEGELVPGHVIVCTVARAEGSDAGEYTLTPSAEIIDDANDNDVTANYAITLVNGTLEIVADEPVNPKGFYLEVADVVAIPGETIDVVISMKNNPGIASIKVTGNFNEELLTLQGVKYNDAGMGGSSNPPQYLKSPVTLNWYNGTGNTYGDIVYATLTFLVSDKITEDVIEHLEFTFDTDDIYSLDGSTPVDVDMEIVGGEITIETHVPGDVNGDKKTNNRDLTLLFQYLTDWEVVVNERALDINGDTKVNNRDLTLLFQYLTDWDVEIY